MQKQTCPIDLGCFNFHVKRLIDYLKRWHLNSNFKFQMLTGFLGRLLKVTVCVSVCVSASCPQCEGERAEGMLRGMR